LEQSGQLGLALEKRHIGGEITLLVFIAMKVNNTCWWTMKVKTNSCVLQTVFSNTG